VPRFLLVSLNIKAILEETTIGWRRERLGAVTNSLGLAGAYDATIGRIKAQAGGGTRLGMAALMWISHSERPLNTDEICHALAVHMGSTEVKANNVPSIRTVLSCCQGLAAVDDGSSTIRLIHFTLKEYLSRHADLFDNSHSKMAETCLTYLNTQPIKELSSSPSHNPQGTPFLEYSSLYWGTHMRMELSDRSKHLALDLLDQYENHISAELLWKSLVEQLFASRKPFSALHCISYFGIAEVAADLIRTKRWDANQRDSAGLTPLMWAAMCGREEVVKSLLEDKHTQSDIPDTEYGRTALSWAAKSGHEGVIRLLLGPPLFNPGSVGFWGKTSRVVSLLFKKKYVNPDRPDDHGRTPLSWAARCGHDGAVKLLLGLEDVSPDTPDDDGRTPLSWAAGNGHDRAVELLLEREDVSSDRPDNYGQTPLSLAAWTGRDGVVKILLGRKDVSPDTRDIYGQTPLWWATRYGHDGVVEILLGRKDVNPDGPDNCGQTPLSVAAENGCDGIVRLLLEQEVSPDRPDNRGRTPLSLARRFKHVEVVKLLEARTATTSSAV